MFTGEVRLVRLDKDLNSSVLFENDHQPQNEILTYKGRYNNPKGVVLIIGRARINNQINHKKIKSDVILLQVDFDGHCTLIKTINRYISETFNVTFFGGCVYLGQKDVIIRLNPDSGEIVYLSDQQ